MPTPQKSQEIPKNIVRIQAGIWAMVMALFGGLLLFAMTAWLLIMGGQNVGQHLSLLQNYFPGYSVSWGGSFVGMFYGMLGGGIGGWSIGLIYNKVVEFRFSGRDK